MPKVYLYDRPIPIEDDDILRDGEMSRVPMMLRDAAKKKRKPANEADETEEDCEATNKDSEMIVTDGFGRPAGHAPGYAYLAPGAQTADAAIAVTQAKMAHDARQQYIADTANAWRRDASEYTGGQGYSVYTGYGSRRVQEIPPGAYPYAPHLVGAGCTLNGRPGKLKERDGYLVCEVGSTDAAMDDRAMAYAEAVDAQQNAWKRKPQR